MNETTPHNRAWPEHLRPGALRWARASSHYEATVAFYRDLVGLPIVGDFAGSFGEDGTILGLPDTGTQLEIVRAHDADEPTGSVDQLVFYLKGHAAVAGATQALRQQGLTPQPASSYRLHAAAKSSSKTWLSKHITAAPASVDDSSTTPCA